jgi:aspartate racemase
MSDSEREQVVGVLGGLGPEATIDFMARVVANTEAGCDQDHIRMLVDHNPGVPDRHRAIAGETASVGPQLAAMAQGLEAAGADFLVMVCNTAHAYVADIRAVVNIPFISIIDVVIEELEKHPLQRVGVMAAEGCLRAGLYQDALKSAGLEPILWNENQQQEFMNLVYRIKAGDKRADIKAQLCTLASRLQKQGAQALIAACTEIPLFLRQEDISIPLFSATDLLVHKTIALARNTTPTED